MDHSQSPSADERAQTARRLSQVEAYGAARRVWVDDGHVFVEEHDGIVVSMTPEVAIELARLIGNAGADSLVNKVMDRAENGDNPPLPKG